MKWKVAGVTLTAIAIATAPMAGAKPATDGNGAKPVTPPGVTISSIAKSGAVPLSILESLFSFKPNNKGLQNAIQQLTKPKPKPKPAPTPAPAPAPEPAPEPSA